MEGISRVDIDKATEVLREKGLTEVADKISKYDIIPKLYVYTYFKKVNDELKSLQGDGKKIDLGDLEGFSDNNPKLQLDFILDKGLSPVKRIQQFLYNGFSREDKFCDFDDSKYHNVKKFGKCENEDHEMDDESNEQKQELTAVYMPDEFTHKYEDNPEWWCKSCSDSCDGGDCEIEVSCDMETD